MQRVYLLLVLLVLALAGCGGATTTQQSTATSTNQSAQAAATADAQSASMQATVDAQSTQSAQNPPKPLQYGVGEPATSGTWQVTINSAKTSQGGQYDQALKPGDIYLTIDFTLKNNSTTAQSLWLFTMRDAQGNTYDSTYLDGDKQSYGTIVSGQQLTGDLSYEVPTAIHSFVLQFDPVNDYDHSQIVQFTIKD